VKIARAEASASTSPLELPSSDEESRTEPLANSMERRVRRPGQFIAAALLAAMAGMGGTEPPFMVSRRRDEAVTESSTELFEVDPVLLIHVRELFEQGASEFFEDGMRSNFSRSLLSMLTQHGRAALRAISEYMFSGLAKPNVASEAVRWLADFNSPATFDQRWAILQRTLRHNSPQVRDEAILGFAALDDPRAANVLRDARNGEKVNQLRTLIDEVVAQLQRNR
jgi:hypothetical protein